MVNIHVDLTWDAATARLPVISGAFAKGHNVSARRLPASANERTRVMCLRQNWRARHAQPIAETRSWHGIRTAPGIAAHVNRLMPDRTF